MGGRAAKARNGALVHRLGPSTWRGHISANAHPKFEFSDFRSDAHSNRGPVGRLVPVPVIVSRPGPHPGHGTGPPDATGSPAGRVIDARRGARLRIADRPPGLREIARDWPVSGPSPRQRRARFPHIRRHIAAGVASAARRPGARPRRRGPFPHPHALLRIRFSMGEELRGRSNASVFSAATAASVPGALGALTRHGGIAARASRIRSFSSCSVPPFRPGVFNHLHLPPFRSRHGNGLLELPLPRSAESAGDLRQLHQAAGLPL
jgi:hypothetical protein